MSFAVILTYMQGEITSDNINKTRKTDGKRRSLFKTNIGSEGYTATEKLRNMGAEMKVFGGKQMTVNEDLFKKSR